MMTAKETTNIETLKAAIADFEQRHSSLSPLQGEGKLIEILRPLLANDGYALKLTRNSEGGGGNFIAYRDGGQTEAPSNLFIEYKHYRKPVNAGIVGSLMGTARAMNCQKAILFAGGGFTNRALQTCSKELPLELELMGYESLRAWVHRIESSRQSDVSPVVKAVTELSQKLARLVALNPRYLDEIEWRDMERLLAAVFKGLGFRVELTRPAKDGGKDVVLTCVVSGKEQKYLVEVKHWCSGQLVGVGKVRRFVKVVASEMAEKGLFLATYGYTQSLAEALTEIEKKSVVLGHETKVVSLCQTFVKAESGLWSPPTALPELLFEDPPHRPK